MEQSIGRSWVFVGISREIWDLRDGTPPNKGKTFPNKKKHQQTKEKPFQTRKNLSKQEKTPPNKGKPFQTRKNTNKQGKHLSSKGYLPIKCKSLQVVGVSRQGKGVVSDGRYGVIGGSRYCLLVWGDAEETKGERGGRWWRGVGPAGRPSLFPFGVCNIKI